MSTEPKSASVGTTPAAPQTSTPVVPTGTPGAPPIDSPPPGSPTEAPDQPQTPGGQRETKSALTADDKEPASSETKPTESEFVPKLPDGFAADDKVLSSIKGIAKADGLKPEVAQKLVDLYVQQQQEGLKAVQEYRTKQNQEWIASAKADKEFGGEKFDANLRHARKAGELFWDDDLKKFFDETGIGNHPAMIRAWVKVGQRIADDSVAGTTGAGAAETSSEEAVYRRMYPKMFQES